MADRRRSRSSDERERRETKDGITRRDFLDGTVVTAAGLAMAAAAPGLTGAQAMAAAKLPPTTLPKDYYPPTFATPNTGQPDRVIRRTFKLDGPPITDPSQIHSTQGGPGIHKNVFDTGERYDCV